MRPHTVTIPLFEKGDRVLTPDGLATVTKDEAVPAPRWMGDRDVQVLLDEGHDKHPSRKAVADGWLCILQPQV